MRKHFAVCALLFASPLFSFSQQAPPGPTTNDNTGLEAKIRDLEDRIVALEGQVRLLKSQSGGQASATSPGAERTFLVRPVGLIDMGKESTVKIFKLWLGPLAVLLLCGVCQAWYRSPALHTPLGYAPDACGMCFYTVCYDGTAYGPNYNVYPPFPPFCPTPPQGQTLENLQGRGIYHQGQPEAYLGYVPRPAPAYTAGGYPTGAPPGAPPATPPGR